MKDIISGGGIVIIIYGSSPSIEGHDFDQGSERLPMDFLGLEHRGTFVRSIMLYLQGF